MSEVTQEELKAAEATYEQGTKLIATDPEQAVELLGKVLELRNKHYGDMAEECVETYLWYGRALLEQARCSTDVLASKPRPSAAAGPSGAGPASEAADTAPAQEANPSSDQASDGSGDEGEEDQEDNGDAEEEGQDADDNAGGDESDDLRLAWEVLELARMICVQGDTQKHTSTLAAVHLTLGDVSAEKEEFDTALAEYERCQTLLESMPEPDKRRLAGVHFSMTLILTLMDNLTLARTHCKQAIALLEARRAEIMVIMDTPVEGETGDEVDSQIDELEKQLDDIDASMQDLKDRIEDLDLAIKEQASFKGVLKAAMQTMANMQDGAGTSGAAATQLAPGAAQGGDTAAAAQAAAPAAPAAPVVVQNLGVVGRGRTRITLQPCQPTSGGATKLSLPVKRNIADISSSDGATEPASAPAPAATVAVGQGEEPNSASENVP